MPSVHTILPMVQTRLPVLEYKTIPERDMTQRINIGRCFVSGGAGFIGSHMVEKLLREGNTVTAYDNLSSGKRKWIEHLEGNPRFTFIQADLLDLATLKKAMAGHDIIIHLGANTNIPIGKSNPRIDLDNDIIATFNVLEAMRANNIQRIIFASSSTVFGETIVRPTPETIGPSLPLSLYGAGKLAGEGLISAYCHLFHMHAWIFRLSNVLGERIGHGAIYDFIRKLRQNPTELEILGNGKQEKNYFMVEDLIEGIFVAFHHSNKQCDVFNLSGESTIKVTDIAKIVVEEMGLKDVHFRYTGEDRGWPGDVPQVQFDTGKMRKLGWRPKYTAEEAIRLTTRYLLDRRDL